MYVPILIVHLFLLLCIPNRWCFRPSARSIMEERWTNETFNRSLSAMSVQAKCKKRKREGKRNENAKQKTVLQSTAASVPALHRMPHAAIDGIFCCDNRTRLARLPTPVLLHGLILVSCSACLLRSPSLCSLHVDLPVARSTTLKA